MVLDYNFFEADQHQEPRKGKILISEPFLLDVITSYSIHYTKLYDHEFVPKQLGIAQKGKKKGLVGFDSRIA